MPLGKFSVQQDIAECARLARLEAYYRDVFLRASMDSEVQKATPLRKTSVSAPTKQRMGFLHLPGEVRNSIYRYALVFPDPINGIETKIPAIGILATSKLVHREASSILYGENTFTFGMEIDWRGLVQIQLAGFPKFLSIWPTPTYHECLRKLYIKIAFTGGLAADVDAPEFLRSQIQSMRKAYDSIWDDLDITYDFCEGNLDKLTFTMAWIKMRFFEPISHPDCKVITNSKISPLVKWCIEHAMQEKEPKSSLLDDQLQALREANEIANDCYGSHSFTALTNLAQRLVWGSPMRSRQPPPQPLPQPAGINATIFSNQPPPLQPPPLPFPFGRSQRLYDRWELYEQLRNLSDVTAKDLILQDNELRVLAALEMPEESRNLNIKDCCELRIYFALQESAMKIAALTRSLQDSPNGDQKRND